jgi:cyclase
MPLTKRIIPCLDVKEGRVVKGKRFVNLQDAGNPVELAKFYDEQGADELVYLDITASPHKSKILKKLVERTAEQVFIPFTVGGGLRSKEDIKEILRAGADKVSLNTCAVKNPPLIRESSSIFGSQCIVIAIDAKRVYAKSSDMHDGKNIIKVDGASCWWQVFINGGRIATGLDAFNWAQEVQKLGAGEILLTSMDMDGTKQGYDIELTRMFSEELNIPIIASGGAGSPHHIIKVFKDGKADAALVASIFHYGEFTIEQVKKECQNSNIPMRF